MSEYTDQLRKICTYHSDGGTSGYLLSEKQFAAILELNRKTIGEDEPYPHLPGTPERKFVERKAQNQLRIRLRREMGGQDGK